MKKTIIALMALAGVSVATEVEIPRGGDYYAGDYSFSFTLSETILSDTNTNDVILAYGNKFDGTSGSGNDCCINAFTLNYADGSITMQVGCGTLTDLGSDGSISDSTSFTSATFGSYTPATRLATMLAVDASGNATTTAYTLAAGSYYVAVEGTSGKQYVSVYKEGSLVAIAGRVSGEEVINWYNGNMTNGHATDIAVKTNSSYNVIPEPTTATLSLLALAGLAARRRRK